MPQSAMFREKPSGTVTTVFAITTQRARRYPARSRQQRLERHLHIGAFRGQIRAATR